MTASIYAKYLSFHFDPRNILQTLNDWPVIIVVARYGGENCPCPVLLIEARIPMLRLSTDHGHVELMVTISVSGISGPRTGPGPTPTLCSARDQINSPNLNTNKSHNTEQI